jgi:signal transduction histidine kinase
MIENIFQILLVEDNPGDARLILQMVKEFESIKAELHRKSTLQEVMELTDLKKWDVILLDLSLPDAFGINLLKSVQQKFKDIPIIVLTGMNDSEMIKNMVGEGVQDYLLKSSTDTVLLERAILYSIWRNKYNDQRIEMEATLREKKKLEELNTSLNKALLKLELSNKQLEEFAYVATHNLRAPMVNLVSLVEMYHPSENGNGVFEKIKYTSNNLNNILSDLIDIVVLNKPAMDTKLISFDEVLDSIEKNMAPQIASTGAVICRDFIEAPSITYPYSRLKSIVLNLVINAIKYRAPDRKCEITVQSKKQDNFICLSVSDNGIGIDMKKHGDKLFRAFKKLHKDDSGKGLGLYIIKSQVEILGGKVNVESELGKGSTFNVFMKDNPEV